MEDSFSENLRKARILKGLKQEELANILGVTQASISQYERGDRIPIDRNLRKICEALDVSLEELTGDDSCEVGQTKLMRKAKGLSSKSLAHLSQVAEFLRNQENRRSGYERRESIDRII